MISPVSTHTCGNVPASRIAGSKGMCIFNLEGYWRITYHRGYTNLHSCYQLWRLLLHYTVITKLLDLCSSIRWKKCNCSLNFVSLIWRNAEHLFSVLKSQETISWLFIRKFEQKQRRSEDSAMPLGWWPDAQKTVQLFWPFRSSWTK